MPLTTRTRNQVYQLIGTVYIHCKMAGTCMISFMALSRIAANLYRYTDSSYRWGRDTLPVWNESTEGM